MARQPTLVVLARFAAAVQSVPRTLLSADRVYLADLVDRRHQLVTTVTAEKNRVLVSSAALRISVEAHLYWLRNEIERIEREMDDWIERHGTLRAQEVLRRSVPGIGALTARTRVWWLAWMWQLLGGTSGCASGAVYGDRNGSAMLSGDTQTLPSFAGEQQASENRLGRVSAPPVGHRERHAEITARLGTGLAASLTFANTATHTLESPVNSARFKRPLLLNFKELEDRITVVVFRTAGAGKRQPSPCQRPAPLKAGTTQWNTCDESLTTEHVGSGGVP